MTEIPEQMEFAEVEVCSNPMEAEIFTAALREAEIPHRTQWKEDGSLILMVAGGWEAQAKETLDRASEVFFNEKRTRHEPEIKGLFRKKSHVQDSEGRQPEVAGNSITTDQAEDTDELAWGRAMFSSDALPTPEETRIRALWPAWALAVIPGLGLGHLYAGKMQMFFYLMFCSLLGGLFFRYTGSAWSFGLVGFSWAMDLGFAAYHVKEHNRSALRAKKRLEKAEKEFYDSVSSGGMNA